jgi:L-seryl-tRNA(Ser) seleniumtransferase
LTDDLSARLRALPSVEKLAARPELAHLSREVAVRFARRAVDEARAALRGAERESAPPPSADALVARAAELVGEAEQPTLRRVINATGVLLHTNLGRAALAPAAARAVAEVAKGHTSLEVDEQTGGRGSRQAHVQELLCELTGADDALVVNNNAAATFLPVAAVAAGREVILSRGQLVEIGGQFRLPDVIRTAGAQLVEVGTTNRTRIGDYEAAITERTAMLLRVHPSNYKIIGFSEEASLDELVALGRKRGVPVYDDIGSGALVDLSPYGLTDEPTAPGSIRAGADVVWFSGDKLLGGPQAGILIGRKDQLSVMAKHPLMRALRPDKLTLAALEATLRLYQAGRAWSDVPVLRRMTRPVDDVRAACERVTESVRNGGLPSGASLDIVPTVSEIGGGSLPGHTLPSFALVVTMDGRSAGDLARALRMSPATPVYGRIERDRLLLDLRTVDEAEEAEVAATLTRVLVG